MSQPPLADRSAPSTEPEAPASSPPTASYRHPQAATGPRARAAPATERSAGEASPFQTEPSPSDAGLTGPEAEPAPLALRDAGEIAGQGDSESGNELAPPILDINTTQRSTNSVVSVGRVSREDGRIARLEEHVALLEARLRLAQKALDKLRLLALFAAVASVLGWALALAF